MAEIKNIVDLRDHIIDTIDRLKKGQITIQEANAHSKLYSNVTETIKSQLIHAKLTLQEPNIAFLLGEQFIEAEHTVQKPITLKITHKSL